MSGPLIMPRFTRKMLYIAACLLSWGAIFAFFFAPKDIPTQMLQEVKDSTNKSTYKQDVTRIVAQHIPLGISYHQAIILLKKNGVTSIVPFRRDELLNPKPVSGEEYIGYFSYSSKLSLSDQYLNIYLLFSEDGQLVKIKATYLRQGI